LICFRNGSKVVAHNVHHRRRLETYEDGVDPRAVIVAEFDQIRQIILEYDLQCGVNLQFASHGNGNN